MLETILLTDNAIVQTEERRRTTQHIYRESSGISSSMLVPPFATLCHTHHRICNPLSHSPPDVQPPVLQMYMSRSLRVCDCSFRLRTLLFSFLLFWTIRPVHSYRTIEYTHTVLPNFHIVTPCSIIYRVIFHDLLSSSERILRTRGLRRQLELGQRSQQGIVQTQIVHVQYSLVMGSARHWTGLVWTEYYYV